MPNYMSATVQTGLHIYRDDHSAHDEAFIFRIHQKASSDIPGLLQLS